MQEYFVRLFHKYYEVFTGTRRLQNVVDIKEYELGLWLKVYIVLFLIWYFNVI